MKRKYEADADVQCPFYQSDDRCTRIVCEGILDKGKVIRVFPNKQDMQQQKEIFCSCKYDKCEWHTALMRAKYDD